VERPVHPDRAQGHESFLVLFFKKEPLSYTKQRNQRPLLRRRKELDCFASLAMTAE
jgi:hypothetical protein